MRSDEGSASAWSRVSAEWPLPSEPGTRSLRPANSPGTYLRYLVASSPFILMVYFLCLVLASIPFESTTPGTGLRYGAMVAIVPTLGFAVIPVHKTRQMIRGTLVVVSPVGVELRDHLGFQVRLRWSDVTQIDRTVDRVAAGKGVQVGTQHVRFEEPDSRGIIGWGERVIPDGHARMRAVLASRPRHPRTGAELVAISFQAAGEDGWDNPLVVETRRYRPDLFDRPPDPSFGAHR